MSGTQREQVLVRLNSKDVRLSNKYRGRNLSRYKSWGKQETEPDWQRTRLGRVHGQKLESSVIRRAFSALWKTDDVVEFEKKGSHLAIKVEIDASNCDRAVNAQQQEIVSQLQQNMQKVLAELQQHHQLPIKSDVFMQATVAESNQMAALLIGCETTLYMASRLQVYIEFWHHLPAEATRNNLTSKD